jgi:hypothetical protein
MRELIAFDGAVECRPGNGAVNLALCGFERRGSAAGTRVAVQALFGGAVNPLPPQLHALRIFELEDAPNAHRFLLQAEELQLTLQSRSLQLHRDAGRAFFAAVPPPRVLWRRRLGWALLLWALRLPGAQALLERVRPTP